MNTITVETNVLKAIRLFMADAKERRYYMRGMCLETGPEGARLTATNGHIIGVHFIPGVHAVSTGIMPGDLLANALKISGKVSTLDIGIESGGMDYARPTYTIAGLCAEGMDGKYPDCTRLFRNETPSGQAAQFDPEYVAAIGKAAKLIDQTTRAEVCIGHNGATNIALVAFKRADFVAAMMPTRTGATQLTSAPAWAMMALNPSADTAKGA